MKRFVFFFSHFQNAEDCGRSSRPARVLLVGTHPDAINCKKNVVGEFCNPPTDSLVGQILSEFGNVFDIHAHAFLIDATSSPNSASMKAFKSTLSGIKSEITDVRESLLLPRYES